MPSAAERSETTLLGRGDSRSHEQTQTGGRGKQVSGGSRNHGGRRAWGARAQACEAVEGIVADSGRSIWRTLGVIQLV